MGFFVPFLQHAAQKRIVNFFVFLHLTILMLKNPFFSFIYLAEVKWRDLSIGMFWRCERKKIYSAGSWHNFFIISLLD